MKKTIIGGLLLSATLLGGSAQAAESTASSASSSSMISSTNQTSTSSSESTGTTDSSTSNVTDVKEENKEVTINKKTLLYKDETLKESTDLESGNVYHVSASCKINGETYYKVTRKSRTGYVKASDVNDFKKVKIEQKLLTGVKAYNYYKNFDWEAKGKINPGSTYTTDGYYVMGNGDKYHSVSRLKDGKLVWYGYVNAKAMNDLTFHKAKDNMLVSAKKEYKRYNDFYFNQRGTVKLGDNYRVRGYYVLGNGKKYYSLCRDTSDGKEKWYGYINAEAMQELKMHEEKKRVTVKNNYKTYSNFFWKTRSTDNVGRNFRTRGYYILGDGRKYYSLY